MSAPEVRSFVIPQDLAGVRLDVALARLAPDLTRSRVQRLVEGGHVRLAGRPAKASARLRGGEPVEVELEPPEPTRALAQDLPLAVLFEDAQLVVLDKAAGMVVHPARGSPHSTVVNALLHHLGRRHAPSQPDLPADRPRPPARQGHLGLPRRRPHRGGARRTSRRSGRGGRSRRCTSRSATARSRTTGRLDTPYGRHPRDRTRFTGRLRSATRRALTEWRVVERFGEDATLVEVTLHTGRTHQIRVHLAEAGHPLLGDATYGGTRREARAPDGLAARAAAAIGRQALHAFRLAFDHPRTGRRLVLEAPLPPEFRRALDVLRGR